MTFSPEPQKKVPRPVMIQNWRSQTFLHWNYDPEVIQRLLPRGLTVDTFDGMGWVSLTPFVLANLHPPGIPPLPWISTTPETNVRTYVRGLDGERAIWFFSLDIARLPAAVFGRGVYFLPYMWAQMLVEEDGDTIRYAARRRLPRPSASYDITVEIGPRYEDEELTDLDHFLTARFVLYTFYGPLGAKAFAEHPRWPLARGRVTNLEEDLLGSIGIPKPEGDPLVHFSPGVEVAISRPYLAFVSRQHVGNEATQGQRGKRA